jgi:uncharacterized membrane protein (UPF0127 family)
MKKITIGDKTFMVKEVDDAEGMRKGLSGIKKLPTKHGLLFNFKAPEEVTMNMYDMVFPLDMLFIDENRVVSRVAPMDPGENEITVPDTLYVLEVNKGEGEGLEGSEMIYGDKNMIVNKNNMSKDLQEKFTNGGSFKLYEEEVKAIPGAMHVLDDTGKVLMNIKGGERIFSIKHTEELLELANKVKIGMLEPTKLGEKMKEIIDMQDKQKPEYVN